MNQQKMIQKLSQLELDLDLSYVAISQSLVENEDARIAKDKAVESLKQALVNVRSAMLALASLNRPSRIVRPS